MQGGATATIGSRFGLPTGSPHWSGWVALGAIDLARPGIATKAYGLSLQDSQDFPFARVKAARELAAGVVALRGC